MQQLDYAPSSYNGHQNPSYYEHGGSYALPPLSPQAQAYNSTFIPQQGPGVPPPYSPQRWTQGKPYLLHPAHPLNSIFLAAPLPPTTSRGHYAGTSPSQTNQQWAPGPSSPPYLETGPSASFNRPLSPSYNYSPTAGTSAGPSPTSDVVPPPRRRISPGSSRDQTGPARTTGNRPTGVQKCSSCKATSSPEWRKGPSGKKELCNA